MWILLRLVNACTGLWALIFFVYSSHLYDLVQSTATLEMLKLVCLSDVQITVSRSKIILKKNYVCVGTGFVDWLDERCIYEKSFGSWICSWQFDCPDLTLCGWCNVKIQLSILPQGSYGSSCLVYFVSLYYMYMWWCVVAFQFQCEHSVQCISNKKQTNYVAKNTHKKTLSLVLVVFANGE